MITVKPALGTLGTLASLAPVRDFGASILGGVLAGVGGAAASTASILGGSLASVAAAPSLAAGASVASLTGGLGAAAGGLAGFASAAIPWIGPGIMAAMLAKQLIGRGRKQADIFVKSAQDPISKRMSDLIKKVEERRVAGTLTQDEAQYALAAFEDQALEYEDIATQFAALGGQQAKVVEQSRATTSPIYTAWREALAEHLRAVTPADALATTAPPPEEPPSLANILDPEGTTPLARARMKSDQQRKRSMGGGRASTILAGMGRPTSAGTKRATLLGY